jgi:hypothetical protein
VHVEIWLQYEFVPQKFVPVPSSVKQKAPERFPLVQEPHWTKPLVQFPIIPLQSFFDFFFLQPSTEAEAGRLVSTGAAHTTAPARPMFLSISRREIRFSESNDFTPSRGTREWN